MCLVCKLHLFFQTWHYRNHRQKRYGRQCPITTLFLKYSYQYRIDIGIFIRFLVNTTILLVAVLLEVTPLHFPAVSIVLAFALYYAAPSRILVTGNHSIFERRDEIFPLHLMETQELNLRLNSHSKIIEVFFVVAFHFVCFSSGFWMYHLMFTQKNSSHLGASYCALKIFNQFDQIQESVCLDDMLCSEGNLKKLYNHV